jgi:hypothetical protein
MILRALVLVAGGVAVGCASAGGGPRVVLVTLDGVRWQEVFRGAEVGLEAGGSSPGDAGVPAGADAGAGDGAGLAAAERRRRERMPFLWETVATQGQIFGNQDRGSRVTVANAFRVSYPGYHELLCGFASPFIRDNLRIPNPNLTVLEWLNRRPGFEGRVAAYTSWDAFGAILNRWRSGLVVDAGTALPPRPTLIERLRAEALPPWKDSVFDAFVFHAAMQYLQAQQPRVLYIALGDTDEWAHAGNYRRYLDSVRRSDRWLRELWETLSREDGYRGRTSLLVTTDHGRGDGAQGWGQHGSEIPGAEGVWVAVIGPGTPALGERRDHPPLTLAQVAATVGALAGEDFAAAAPKAAPSLPLTR